MNVALSRLRPLAAELIADGWQPELIAFAPSEITRISGYKVALIIPLDHVSEDTSDPTSPTGSAA